MFIFGENDATGPILIPQVSHSWLAWQLADHWGNRRHARPRPRAEVLAAVLLHDTGWGAFDRNPGIDEAGRPRTFDRMPVPAHLEIWRTSVNQAAMHSRYAGLLVANHFANLAGRKSRDLLNRSDIHNARAVESFTAEMKRHRGAWREMLALDARYEISLDGPGWRTNSAILAACDLISVHLCGTLASSFAAQVPSADGESLVEVAFDEGGDRTWRVRPWPFEGSRLRVHCEGRRLPQDRFPSSDALHESLQMAPVERLTFTFQKTSAGS